MNKQFGNLINIVNNIEINSDDDQESVDTFSVLEKLQGLTNKKPPLTPRLG